MKKILILTDKMSVELNQFNASSFKQLLEVNPDISVEICHYEDLIYVIEENSVKIVHQYMDYDIADFDVVYRKRSEKMPHHAVSCSMHVRSKGKVFIDSEFNSEMNANAHKLVEHMIYAQSNLPFPKTILVSKYNMQSVLNGNFGVNFPAILKSLTGTRGEGNFLVNSPEEVIETIKQSDEDNFEFALQPFIENDSDYRFLVLGYETKVIIRRIRDTNSSSHTNNTSRGASAELVDIEKIDTSLIELANRAAKNFHREVAGVDIMICLDDGRPYILEVNRSPQIEQGAFVQQKSEKLAEFLAQL